MSDMVNHPDHYKGASGLEAKDVIKAFTAGLNGYDAFCAGNAIKYVLRWYKKNGTEDLEKAIWYINELVEMHKFTKMDIKNGDMYAYTE